MLYQLRSLLPVLLLLFMMTAWKATPNDRITDHQKNYDFVYSTADKKNIKEYKQLINNGIESANKFFNSSYRTKFQVVIHPDRQSLDSTWQKDWSVPDFKSECWMVASGIASKLDVLSPKTWDSSSCEHHYRETIKTQQLITHELVHVYHGQLNMSPDFSDVEGIDWFVEGLATYASGQCDSIRIAEVKKAIEANTVPEKLDNFWMGKLKYGLSGSLVMYIDHTYGRDKVKALLPFNRKSEILTSLNTTESALLEDWRNFMLKL